MGKIDRIIRITSPIGSVPKTDSDLHERIARLPPDEKLENVFKEFGEWEENAVRKSRDRELTAKSGVLHIACR